MESSFYKKFAEDLEELSSKYALAAKEALKSRPGEFHRLMTLSEKATELAEDLTNVYWRQKEKKLSAQLEEN